VRTVEFLLVKKYSFTIGTIIGLAWRKFCFLDCSTCT